MVAIIEPNRAELNRLCARYHVGRLELFGSAAGGRFDPARSDLDFLVEFRDVPPGQHADCYFGLLEALESLFGRRIDLVEAKAIDNPYFLAGIGPERKVLYAA
jgi:predicted nucleotidyltransferase